VDGVFRIHVNLGSRKAPRLRKADLPQIFIWNIGLGVLDSGRINCRRCSYNKKPMIPIEYSISGYYLHLIVEGIGWIALGLMIIFKGPEWYMDLRVMIKPWIENLKMNWRKNK
jgi:hypothetical protein